MMRENGDDGVRTQRGEGAGFQGHRSFNVLPVKVRKPCERARLENLGSFGRGNARPVIRFDSQGGEQRTRVRIIIPTENKQLLGRD